MASEQTRPENMTWSARALLLLILATSMAFSEVIWRWLPTWVPVYRVVVVALSAALIIALWGCEFRRRWVRRHPR